MITQKHIYVYVLKLKLRFVEGRGRKVQRSGTLIGASIFNLCCVLMAEFCVNSTTSWTHDAWSVVAWWWPSPYWKRKHLRPYPSVITSSDFATSLGFILSSAQWNPWLRHWIRPCVSTDWYPKHVSGDSPAYAVDNEESDIIIIKSSDNIEFQVHRKNLEANAGAFPCAEFKTNNEAVQLSETGKTLELVFQFIYPRRHPTLEGLPFSLVADIAEAAEKYEIFAIMNIACIRLRCSAVQLTASTTYTMW